MLTLAAREADIIVLIPPIEEKLNWIREAAGERFECILELGQAAFGIELTDSPIAAAPISPRGIPVEPRPMTTEQAIGYLSEQRDQFGISYIQIQERQLENFIPVFTHLNGK